MAGDQMCQLFLRILLYCLGFLVFVFFFKYKPIIFIIQIIILKIKNYLCRLLFQIVGLDFPTYLRGDKTIMLITIIFCSPL